MIISIDPGVTNCGVSRLEMKGNKLHIIEKRNIRGTRKLRGEHKEVGDQYGDRTAKVLRIMEELIEILDAHPEIKTIAIEEPFFNRKMPNAFKSLLEVVIPIRYEIAVPRGLDLALIAPKEAKMFWAGKGNVKGKEPMEEALDKKVKNGEVVFEFEYDKLTEHEIDSFAIGYTYFKLEELKNEKL